MLFEMTLELKHLRFFVAVAETRSFTAAARMLYVSQQAVSRVIQQLERELGVPLLVRNTRSVELTTAGMTLLESAKRSIAVTEDAFEAARHVGKLASARPLKIDLSSAALMTPARILRQMRRHHPEIPLHLVEDGVPRGITALLRGRLDAVLGLATNCPPEVPTELIHTEPILVAMAASHPLAQLEAVPVAQLAEAELLLPSDSAAIEWVEHVYSFCTGAGVTPRRWPGATHGSTAAADVLRDIGCITPTVAWADPPDDIVFRPLVDPTPMLPWALMLSPIHHERDEVKKLLRVARSARYTLSSPRPSAHHRRPGSSPARSSCSPAGSAGHGHVLPG